MSSSNTVELVIVGFGTFLFGLNGYAVQQFSPKVLNDFLGAIVPSAAVIGCTIGAALSEGFASLIATGTYSKSMKGPFWTKMAKTALGALFVSGGAAVILYFIAPGGANAAAVSALGALGAVYVGGHLGYDFTLPAI